MTSTERPKAGQKPLARVAKDTGVTLDEELIQKLDRLAAQEERSRSWLIRQILREHLSQVAG